jgi:hypothetical protein
MFFNRQKGRLRFLTTSRNEEPTADGKPQKIFSPKALTELREEGLNDNGTFILRLL